MPRRRPAPSSPRTLTVRERLARVQGALAIARAAIAGADELDDGTLWEALEDLLDNASGEVHWVLQLPEPVLDQPAPDIVDREASALRAV